MKRVIATTLVLSFLLGPMTAHAFYYEAKCMVPQGKFKKCFLDFSKQDTLKITHKDFEYSNLNREITGRSIRHIAMGEKAQRRWAAFGVGLYALGPIGALFILWKKKSAIFSVEHKIGKKNESVLFGIKKKLGPEVMNRLEEISGKEVDFEIGKQ